MGKATPTTSTPCAVVPTWLLALVLFGHAAHASATRLNRTSSRSSAGGEVPQPALLKRLAVLQAKRTPLKAWSAVLQTGPSDVRRGDAGRTALVDSEPGHNRRNVFRVADIKSHELPQLEDALVLAEKGHQLVRKGNTTALSYTNATRKKEHGCGVVFQEHPDEVTCPSACPFTRNWPTGICEFSCVRADECGQVNPLATFANPETMHCGVCNVVACKACGGDSRTCAMCQAGFDLVDGQCLIHDRWWQYAFYWSCVCLTVVAISYFVLLSLRPNINEEVVEAGIKFRNLAKTRQEQTGKLYSLFKTDLSTEYVSGVGIMLHFRWQWAMIIYTSILAIVLYLIAFILIEEPKIMGQNTQQRHVFDACKKDVADQVEMATSIEKTLFLIVFIIYVISTIAAIAFAVRQKRFATVTSESEMTMQDYCIAVSGLPPFSGTTAVEEDLKKFFQNKFSRCGDPVDVIGVSPCWNYRKHTTAVHDRSRWESEIVGGAFGKTRWWVREDEGVRGPAVPDTARSSEQGGAPEEGAVYPSTPPTPRSPRVSVSVEDYAGHFTETSRLVQCHVSGFFKKLDPIFGFPAAGADDEDPYPDQEKDARFRTSKEVRVMLESLYTSDTAFVVCGTEMQRNRVLEYYSKNKLKYDGYPLSLSVEEAEPESIMWENVGMGRVDRLVRYILGVAALVITVLMLDLLFYFPSVSYLRTMSDIVGMTQGGTWGMVMGGLVVISNQIIYQVIGVITDKLGFTRNDAHQRFYVCFYTGAVFFNTLVDMYIVLLLAQGYSLEQAVAMQATRDGNLNTQAIADNPSMQRAIHVQFTAYLVPSCLLLPFLIEPLAYAGLFHLMTWLVRSNDVPISKAETALACPPFDLSRYGDISINAMLCACTLAFTNKDLYYLFFWLAVSLVWLVAWDRYRFLRLTTRSSFVTSSMDDTAHMLCALPCAIIAGCLAFRLYGMKLNSFTQSFHNGVDAVLDRIWFKHEIAGQGSCAIAFVMVFFGLVHLCVHIAILRYLVPRWATPKAVQAHDPNVPYSEKAQLLMCNWFNSNPVYCLRSKYFYKYKIPCEQSYLGKERHTFKPALTPRSARQGEQKHDEEEVRSMSYWRSASMYIGGDDELDDFGDFVKTITNARKKVFGGRMGRARTSR